MASCAGAPSSSGSGALPSTHHPGPYAGYHGGPILVAPKVYLTFWGYRTYGDPDGVQSLLETYTQNMGGSGHNNIETQYYELSGANVIHIRNPANQYGGSWNDDSAVPGSPSVEQIAAEAVKATEHFGYDPNGLYVVATARGRSAAGFGIHWCSYHSNASYGGNNLPYVNLPYVPDAGAGCGADIVAPPADESGIDEGVTVLAGHEYGETVTDPQPFSGWNGARGEIGDYCAWLHIANVRFGGKSYAAQPMLSDATASCVQTYP